MFRAIVKQRENLDLKQIADVGVLEDSTINEDLTQKKTSTIIVDSLPLNVKKNDIVILYDNTGRFINYSVINSINDNKLSVSQFNSIFSDDILLAAITDEDIKEYYKTKPISYISDIYLSCREKGMVAILFSVEDGEIVLEDYASDLDVKNTFKGFKNKVIDDDQTFMPFPVETDTLSLEAYLYDIFNTYNRIARPYLKNDSFVVVLFNPKDKIEYENGKFWDYEEKVLFDGWERISNISITKEDADINTVYILNGDKTEFRGGFTILKDNTIREINFLEEVPERLGTGKTKYVFDDDNTTYDLAKAELPNVQYNHNITFDIEFDDIYKFEDFNLGQPIKFYANGILYESVLTAWQYKIAKNSDVVERATFTLGKVRNTLTDKINKAKLL